MTKNHVYLYFSCLIYSKEGAVVCDDNYKLQFSTVTLCVIFTEYNKKTAGSAYFPMKKFVYVIQTYFTEEQQLNQ